MPDSGALPDDAELFEEAALFEEEELPDAEASLEEATVSDAVASFEGAALSDVASEGMTLVPVLPSESAEAEADSDPPSDVAAPLPDDPHDTTALAKPKPTIRTRTRELIRPSPATCSRATFPSVHAVGNHSAVRQAPNGAVSALVGRHAPIASPFQG
jgi:hypothetical protein